MWRTPPKPARYTLSVMPPGGGETPALKLVAATPFLAVHAGDERDRLRPDNYERPRPFFLGGAALTSGGVPPGTSCRPARPA